VVILKKYMNHPILFWQEMVYLLQMIEKAQKLFTFDQRQQGQKKEYCHA